MFKRRLNILESQINEINSRKEDTKIDTLLECGLEYNKNYPFRDENFLKLYNGSEKLKQLRIDKLYESIWNFTQTYYSLKEHINKSYPHLKNETENFFSNDKIFDLMSRKDICNDLKHNPQKDLVHCTGIIKKETIKEPTKIQYISYFETTWFYGKRDSIELCNKLYNDLINFLKLHNI
jgi:hypothetical protein